MLTWQNNIMISNIDGDRSGAGQELSSLVSTSPRNYHGPNTPIQRAQHIFPLRRLKRFGMGPQILKKFYSYTILTGCITAWYGNCTALQRVVPVHHWGQASWHPGPTVYIRRCQRKAQKNVKDSSHPSHRLFSLLPQGKRYQSAKSRYKGPLNSLYPQAILLLNN